MSARTWIQVIDDDESVLEVVVLVLGQRGYQARTAADGVTALEQLRAGTPPSVILLDMRMPRLNGIDFIQALKADPALASIPVLILSGDPAAAETGLALGAVGFLRKPFELSDLVTRIETVLPRNSGIL